MKTEIGKVTIEYNQAGGLVSSLFQPTMKVTLDDALENELKTIECCTEAKELEHNASLVLASFFNRINKIELRDITTEQISSNIDELERYEDKRIKKAVITYLFDDGQSL